MAQRDINKINKTILDNFYKLVHIQPNIRLSAAASTYKILKSLKNGKSQSIFNENLNYCVERLVTGLASSRGLARRGYGVLLLELLKSNQISTERLFNIAHQKFGQINKETTRDNLLAYFLLIAIVLESRNHLRTKTNNQYLEKIYKHLVQLEQTKSYLDYSVSKLLVEHHNLFHTHMLADIPPGAFGSDARLSSFDLLRLILCNKNEPLKGLLEIDNSGLRKLFLILSDDRFQKRPLHPIFFEMSMFLIQHMPNQFDAFHKEILFPTFFKANHNELAAMGLELASKLIISTPNTAAIKTLLSDHVIRLVILSLRNRTTLHKNCTEFLDSLKKHFQDTIGDTTIDNSSMDEKQYTIINRLTSSPGSIAFDEDSRSSSISGLIQCCSSNVLRRYIERLFKSVSATSRKEERGQVKHACAKQLAFVIRRPQLLEDQATIMRVTKFLLLNSMFKCSDPESDEWSSDATWKAHSIPVPCQILDDSVRSSFRNSYHTALDHIVSSSRSAQRTEQLEALINFANQLLTTRGLDYVGAGPEIHAKRITKLWSSYSSSLSSYRKMLEGQKDTKQLCPITTLYLFYGLQIIEHGLDCGNQIAELDQSSRIVIKGDSADGSWADILTDQILAILSATECSPWIRKLCESIFGSLLPHISQTSIDLLCDALKAPMSDDDGEDDSDGEIESNDTEDSDDGEGDVEDEEDSELVAVEDSSAEDDKMSVDDVESYTNGNHSDSEEYLDDEQMMKLDSVIADMFKLRRKSRGNSSIMFKLRCLDLVRRIVVKKNDSEIINSILATIVPLGKSAMKRSETRPISDKIAKLLAKVPSKKRYPKWFPQVGAEA